MHHTKELATLFFQSALGGGGQGYAIKVLRRDGSEIECAGQAEQESGSVTAAEFEKNHTRLSAPPAHKKIYKTIWMQRTESFFCSLCRKEILGCSQSYVFVHLFAMA